MIPFARLHTFPLATPANPPDERRPEHSAQPTAYSRTLASCREFDRVRYATSGTHLAHFHTASYGSLVHDTHRHRKFFERAGLTRATSFGPQHARASARAPRTVDLSSVSNTLARLHPGWTPGPPPHRPPPHTPHHHPHPRPRVSRGRRAHRRATASAQTLRQRRTASPRRPP